MEKKPVNNIIELTELLDSKLNFDYLQPFVFANIDFAFVLGKNFSELLKLNHSFGNGSIATTFSTINYFIFDNCTFTEKIIVADTFGIKLTFKNNCIINGLDFKEATFENNIRFYECVFKKECNFTNTKFKDLLDFWNSTFEKPMLFYKTDFLSITVFSACTFKQNVLFTYSLFKDKVIFRGTTFDKGLDISLAINSGEYNFFNISLNNYQSKKHSNEGDYSDMISNYIIPTINKKETFRIIKQHFQNNGDDLEYVKYLKLEKKPIYEIIKNNFKNTKLVQFWDYIHHIFDMISLGLNRISNNHRNSYLLGIIFTISVGMLFFWFSILSFPDYQFQWNPCKWYIDDFWKHYLTFMNPTHSVDIFEEFKPTGWTYFWQTCGRIFVGYGIYQTIQAYRKLK
jgi:hypothetical protein